MKKIFRMKYEPCNGKCYTAPNTFPLNPVVTDAEATELLDKVIEMHEFACGNEGLAYGIDLDEEREVFVGSFLHFGNLDLVTSDTAMGCLANLHEVVMEWRNSDAGSTTLRENPGLGHDVCEHGEDQDLRAFALKFSGLGPERCAAILAA